MQVNVVIYPHQTMKLCLYVPPTYLGLHLIDCGTVFNLMPLCTNVHQKCCALTLLVVLEMIIRPGVQDAVLDIPHQIHSTGRVLCAFYQSCISY